MTLDLDGQTTVRAVTASITAALHGEHVLSMREFMNAQPGMALSMCIGLIKYLVIRVAHREQEDPLEWWARFAQDTMTWVEEEREDG